MKEIYSIEQMVERWRVRLGYAPLRHDGPVEVTEGIDVDTIIRERIEDWYTDLLKRGPIGWLGVEDVTPLLTIEGVRGGVMTLRRAENVERLVSIKLLEWQREARIVSADERHEIEMQTSRYIRGGACEPVAVLGEDGTVRLYSTSVAKPIIEYARGVVRPVDDSIVIDSAALASIPSRL